MSYEDYNDETSPIIARPGEVTPLPWSCGMCGERNETLLDPSGGYEQEYVEDCTVCCRPNLLRISVDPGSLEVWVESDLE